MPWKQKVAQSLGMPLVVRALDAKNKNSVLNDKYALKVLNELDVTFAEFNKPSAFTFYGILERAKYFDDFCHDFIKKNTNPVIIQLGCGLDARIARIEASLRNKAKFYAVDLPEVIATREKLIPTIANEKNISADITSTRWLEDLKDKHATDPVLIIAEGILYYLTEKEVKDLFIRVCNAFKQGELIYDSFSKIVVTFGKISRLVRSLKAPFKWGVNNDKAVAKWHIKLHWQSTVPILNLSKKHYKLARVLSNLPLVRSSIKLVHFSIYSNY